MGALGGIVYYTSNSSLVPFVCSRSIDSKCPYIVGRVPQVSLGSSNEKSHIVHCWMFNWSAGVMVV